jgi:hypothetical protein
MEVSFNFLIQATRVLNIDEYYEDDLNMIYKFLLSLDNETLIDYYKKQTLFGYQNDLELYLDIVDSLINVFEITEEYEKCEKLLGQKNKTLKLKKYVNIKNVRGRKKENP